MICYRIQDLTPDEWDNILQWCEEHLSTIPMWRNVSQWNYYDPQYIDLYFRTKQDVMMFKLVWS
jgi:hypothetical protein